MALQTSGEISLSDVNLELGLGATSNITMSSLRVLADVPSGPIGLDDLYGASDTILDTFITAGVSGFTRGYVDGGIGSITNSSLTVNGATFTLSHVTQLTLVNDFLSIGIRGANIRDYMSKWSLKEIIFDGITTTVNTTITGGGNTVEINWNYGDMPVVNLVDGQTYPITLVERLPFEFTAGVLASSYQGYDHITGGSIVSDGVVINGNTYEIKNLSENGTYLTLEIGGTNYTNLVQTDVQELVILGLGTWVTSEAELFGNSGGGMFWRWDSSSSEPIPDILSGNTYQFFIGAD